MSHHAHGICGGFQGMSAPVFSGGQSSECGRRCARSVPCRALREFAGRDAGRPGEISGGLPGGASGRSVGHGRRAGASSPFCIRHRGGAYRGKACLASSIGYLREVRGLSPAVLPQMCGGPRRAEHRKSNASAQAEANGSQTWASSACPIPGCTFSFWAA